MELIVDTLGAGLRDRRTLMLEKNHVGINNLRMHLGS